jgi:hypothetical protein
VVPGRVARWRRVVTATTDGEQRWQATRQWQRQDRGRAIRDANANANAWVWLCSNNEQGDGLDKDLAGHARQTESAGCRLRVAGAGCDEVKAGGWAGCGRRAGRLKTADRALANLWLLSQAPRMMGGTGGRALKSSPSQLPTRGEDAEADGDAGLENRMCCLTAAVRLGLGLDLGLAPCSPTLLDCLAGWRAGGLAATADSARWRRRELVSLQALCVCHTATHAPSSDCEPE